MAKSTVRSRCLYSCDASSCLLSCQGTQMGFWRRWQVLTKLNVWTRSALGRRHGFSQAMPATHMICDNSFAGLGSRFLLSRTKESVVQVLWVALMHSLHQWAGRERAACQAALSLRSWNDIICRCLISQHLPGSGPAHPFRSSSSAWWPSRDGMRLHPGELLLGVKHQSMHMRQYDLGNLLRQGGQPVWFPVPLKGHMQSEWDFQLLQEIQAGDDLFLTYMDSYLVENFPLKLSVIQI